MTSKMPYRTHDSLETIDEVNFSDLSVVMLKTSSGQTFYMPKDEWDQNTPAQRPRIGDTVRISYIFYREPPGGDEGR